MPDIPSTMAAYANWKTQPYNGQLDDKCNRKFTSRAITEITKRIRKRDFILCWYGTAHQRIASKFPDAVVVEPSIGTFKSFAKFRVLASF